MVAEVLDEAASRVEHELAFGPNREHWLDTFFRYNEEQGDLARDELELVPRLTLQHTDRFQTVYRYGFYRFELGVLGPRLAADVARVAVCLFEPGDVGGVKGHPLLEERAIEAV